MAFVFDNVRFRKLLRTQPWDAYEFLYQHFRIPLINVATRLTRDRHAAHDIVQDSFMVMWNMQKKLYRTHEKAVENYLAKIVRYKAMTYFKRRRHLDIDVVTLYQEFTNEEESIESYITQELYKEFRQVIHDLPPRQKQCLTMKIDKLMSLDEIAAKLKISRKTVELCQWRFRVM